MSWRGYLQSVKLSTSIGLEFKLFEAGAIGEETCTSIGIYVYSDGMVISRLINKPSLGELNSKVFEFIIEPNGIKSNTSFKLWYFQTIHEYYYDVHDLFTSKCSQMFTNKIAFQKIHQKNSNCRLVLQKYNWFTLRSRYHYLICLNNYYINFTIILLTLILNGRFDF